MVILSVLYYCSSLYYVSQFRLFVDFCKFFWEFLGIILFLGGER